MLAAIGEVGLPTASARRPTSKHMFQRNPGHRAHWGPWMRTQCCTVMAEKMANKLTLLCISKGLDHSIKYEVRGADQAHHASVKRCKGEAGQFSF